MEFEEEIQDKEYFEEKIRCLEAKIMMLQDEVSEHKEITKQGFNNIKSACDDILKARPYVRMGIKRYDMMASQNQAVQEVKINPILLESVDKGESVFFSVRTINALKCANIITVGDLVQCSALDLLKIPNLGKISLREIKEELAQHSLYLNKVDTLYKRTYPLV